MIDFTGALMAVAQTLGGATLNEMARKKEYQKEKEFNRSLARKRLARDTSQLSEDLGNQYLSSGLNPATLRPKIFSMFRNIDTILNRDYGPISKPNSWRS
jgi:hypothetical protein